MRGRSYVDSGETWLEVKTRAARGVTVKTSILHHDVELAPLNPDGRAFVTQALEGQGVRPGDVPALEPMLVTTYRR